MTTLVTDQALDEARQQVQTAEKAVSAARRNNDGVLMNEAGERHDRALGAVQRLLDLQAAQTEALAARAEKEKALRAEMKEISQQLAASVATTAAAIVEGRIPDMAAGITAHQELIAIVHARMVDMGLPVYDDVATYTTGHTSTVSGPAVMVDGLLFATLPRDALLVRAFGAALRGLVDERDPAAVWAFRYGPAAALSKREDALLLELGRLGMAL